MMIPPQPHAQSGGSGREKKGQPHQISHYLFMLHWTWLRMIFPKCGLIIAFVQSLGCVRHDPMDQSMLYIDQTFLGIANMNLHI